MSDTEQDPLTSRLAYLAGTMDDDDRPTLSDMLKTARAYLAPHIAGYTLAQPLLDDVVLGISLDLWQAKDARNGIVGLTVDGVEPFRISTDPMRSAWPKLRAAGIPAGMGCHERLRQHGRRTDRKAHGARRHRHTGDRRSHAGQTLTGQGQHLDRTT